MANTLREAGYVVVVPDYRKYPQVKAEGMYEDIREAIKWTHKHASQINGDPELIFIMVKIYLLYGSTDKSHFIS